MYSRNTLLFVIFVFGVVGAFPQVPAPTGLPQASTVVEISAKNTAIRKALEAGNAAFAKKDYDAAIAIYDAAAKADPTHPGVPTLLVNKTYAQISRGRELFNAGIANKDAAGKEAGKAYLRSAAETSSKAVSVARGLNFQGTRLYEILVARKEAMLIYTTRVDTSSTLDALLAFNEYFALERDEEKAVNGHIDLGGLLVTNGSYAAGQEEYEKVLQYFPRNPAALFGLGEVLLKLAAEKNDDKALIQKAANAFKTYLAVAPANDLKQKDVTDFLKYIKENYKIVPK